MLLSVRIGFALLVIYATTPAVYSAQAQIYAATPQQAATAAFYDHSRVTIVRTNLVGRYATVLTRGGEMESSAVEAPILVERFSFGWQRIALLNDDCFLAAQALSRDVRAALMQGMSKPGSGATCLGVTKDFGPASEVEAVRRQM
jgi:hypothetical protein